MKLFTCQKCNGIGYTCFGHCINGKFSTSKQQCWYCNGVGTLLAENKQEALTIISNTKCRKDYE
jgi:DnaJ-class molecular chaperone